MYLDVKSEQFAAQAAELYAPKGSDKPPTHMMLDEEKSSSKIIGTH